MKIYKRIFHFVPALFQRIVKFYVFSIFSTLFSLLNVALAIPMLGVLFDQNAVRTVPPLPDFSFSIQYATGMFNHYFTSIVVSGGTMKALIFICVAVVISNFLYNLFSYMTFMVISRIKVDITQRLRVETFDRVSKLHIGYFSDQRKGDLISRYIGDITEIENSVLFGMKFAMKEPITILVYFAILIFISFKLTMFTLIVLPLTGWALGGIMKRLKQNARDVQESSSRLVSILDETFSGMRVVKAFNARKFILNKIEKEAQLNRKVSLSFARKHELASPVSETIGILVVALILYFGGTLVLGAQSSLKPEAFIGFIAIFASIIKPAKNFSTGIATLQKGVISLERIFHLIDQEPAIQNLPNAKPVSGFNERIVFENVSFAYDKEYVLKDINLTIEKGKSVALVGPSGGGKSTLADLVPRFYDPTAGSVLLDGHSLKEYDIESLRRLVGVVTQESILFNDTIFNNIAFGMENVKEEDVIQAAKVANAHEFIMATEEGYQTMIGERGSKLSGGQRQRISIARAVLKNPPILILDEATSALDSESERLVQDALFNLMKNRTSLIIAHRLSTIQHADEIIVIRDGEIIERGCHDDLLNQDGLYKRLREYQKH